MAKIKVILFLLSLTSVTLYAQDYRWNAEIMDGSRTGCTATSADNVRTSLGYMDENGYVSPAGNVYPASSATAAVASIVIAAQSHMKRVKQVIGFSEAEMGRKKRECPLSNWYIGIIMESVEKLSCRKVDVGIGNFGGIRQDLPQGEVILDDILSMFPFRNNLVYLDMRGSELRKLFEKMTSTMFQIVGGAEILVEDGRLVEVRVGGEPLDDDRIYGVATISFLLHGGDSLTLADYAIRIKSFDTLIIDAVLEYLERLDAEGKTITPPDVRYVTIR